MIRHDTINKECCDYYEYHGNTTIEMVRKQGETIVWRDWLVFDSVEEASEYFNEKCGLEV